MEHIKTPVRHDPSRGDTIKDARHRLIAVLVPGAVECASELVVAVNEHDDLVAQRDALAGACIVSRQMLADIAKYYDVILQDVGMDAMVRRVEQATRAALALVKGDQKSDDATT